MGLPFIPDYSGVPPMRFARGNSLPPHPIGPQTAEPLIPTLLILQHRAFTCPLVVHPLSTPPLSPRQSWRTP